MKRLREQVKKEIEALDALKKYIFKLSNIGLLTKSLLINDINNFQETLRESWGIHEIESSASFNISNENLRLHEIQMQSESGEWIRVGHGGFARLPVGVTIRLEANEQFFEANGQIEFPLSASPHLIQNRGEHAIWIIHYQR